MQFDKYVGYFAVGDIVVFRPLQGEDVEVCRAPPDIDAHTLADALNSAANGIFALVFNLSTYRF